MSRTDRRRRRPGVVPADQPGSAGRSDSADGPETVVRPDSSNRHGSSQRRDQAKQRDQAEPVEDRLLEPEVDLTGADDSAAPAPLDPAQAWSEHDPTGLDLAQRVAQGARGGRPAPRRSVRPIAEQATWSGPGPSSRDPQPVGRLMDRVFVDRGWGTDLSLAALLGQWADFVGSVNADHSHPEGFRDGQLTVRAESTSWAGAIRLIAPGIIARLNQALGQDSVTSLRVLGPTAPSWKKGRRSVPGRGPRDTYG
ncbi:MAG: DciA family protein [Propionibacteriaceae bacterium]|jgi:predicted nucleic acid-binding Zn ribbon protein|nr:DciA family protein [Propionibacteriaceae bacterium]